MTGSLALSAIGLSARPARARARRIGPNDTIRAAVIGIRGRGGNHIDGLQRLEGVEVVALCDVDEKVLAGKRKQFAEKYGREVEGETDMRRLFDRDDIDVVSTATPNHWHSLLTIWACQAGKDVYVEKPVSHNVWEGRQMVNAARRYNRIVQTGTQCRSSRAIAEAASWVQAGKLGSIKIARGFCYKPRRSIGKVTGPQGVPAHIDYDRWLGPAPLEPLMRKNLHYDWHWDFSTGNGDLGNQGIHQVDLCRWFLGEPRLSSRVMSVGGRFGYADDSDTPNTLITLHDYPTAPLLFEVRGLPRDKQAQEENWGGGMDNYKGVRVGAVIECEDGRVVVPNYNSAQAYDTSGEKVQEWKGAEDHFANFIDAVRSRKQSDLNSDIEEGHVSSGLCHTGNISYKLGRSASPDEIKQELDGTPLLEAWERMQSHLVANGVEGGRATLGPRLLMDPKSETFEDNAMASSMLSRAYRPGYGVPSMV